MSKREINHRNGKVLKNRKQIGESVAKKYAVEEYKKNKHLNPPKKQKGIRLIVIEAYEKGGKSAAYKAIEMANERIGVPAYTEKDADKWIEEYEQTR